MVEGRNVHKTYREVYNYFFLKEIGCQKRLIFHEQRKKKYGVGEGGGVRSLTYCIYSILNTANIGDI